MRFLRDDKDKEVQEDGEFNTITVNVTGPPDSGTDIGSAVLVTTMLAGISIGTMKPSSQRHFAGEPGKASSGVSHNSFAPDCRQLVQLGNFN